MVSNGIFGHLPGAGRLDCRAGHVRLRCKASESGTLEVVLVEEDTGGVLVGGRVKSDETLGNGVVVRSLYSVLGNVERVVELG